MRKCFRLSHYQLGRAEFHLFDPQTWTKYRQAPTYLSCPRCCSSYLFSPRSFLPFLMPSLSSLFSLFHILVYPPQCSGILRGTCATGSWRCFPTCPWASSISRPSGIRTPQRALARARPPPGSTPSTWAPTSGSCSTCPCTACRSCLASASISRPSSSIHTQRRVSWALRPPPAWICTSVSSALAPSRCHSFVCG